MRASAKALQARGITSPVIFYDNGARGSQTADTACWRRGRSRGRWRPLALLLSLSPASNGGDPAAFQAQADIVAQTLTIPRAGVEPEFRWLEARGLGALEGSSLRESAAALRAMDREDIDNRAEPTDDGAPSLLRGREGSARERAAARPWEREGWGGEGESPWLATP